METSKIFHVSDGFDNQWQEILSRCGKPKDLSIRFLPSLDDSIWGLKKQKLVVVGARPSNGKSVFMLQLALDFSLQGKTVYFFSFEMTFKVCQERLISLYCEIDNWLLRTGQIAQDKYAPFVRPVRTMKEKIEGLNFFIFEEIGRSLPELEELSKAVDKKPDVVIIDYGNLVSEKGYANKKQAYDEYIKGFRALAIKEDFCGIIGAQINRNTTNKDGEQRHPTLSDLKDTGELEQTADQVFLLHFPYHYDKNENTKRDYLIDIAKNRDGKTGKHWCDFHAELGKIQEKVKDDEAT
jgi:replicative DNA helicase